MTVEMIQRGNDPNRSRGLTGAGPRALLFAAWLTAQIGCAGQPGPDGLKLQALSDIAGDSALATWTCTDDPCPWGSSLTGQVLPWPADSDPVATRLGYTVSPAAYLPAASANGATVAIDAGSASVYAGQPNDASHRLIDTLDAGESLVVSGLGATEVLSVQSGDVFSYHVTPAAPGSDPGGGSGNDPGSGSGSGSDPGSGSGSGSGSDPGGGSGDPTSGSTDSQTVTWTCTGSPCPWGNSLDGIALVWPADSGAINNRLGYTVSAAIYLPAARANGTSITIDDGAATAYAGQPGAASHRVLGTISEGQTFTVSGLVSGEVLSVQSDADTFSYHATLGDGTDPGGGDPGSGNPPPDSTESVQALWRCNSPSCAGGDWTGAAINWPSWAAHQSNGRTGNNSRSVFASDQTTPLYPYMGAWADGCQVTSMSGTVLIIVWQRGTDVWDTIWLNPGQSATIHLTPPQNSAMIETDDAGPNFRVALSNCTPQPVPAN